MNNQLDPLAHAKDTLLDLAVRFGPKLLVAILILTVGFFVAGWVGRATLRGLRRLDLEPPVRQLLTRVARVLVVGLFAIMALQNLGVELLPLIAGLGVAGAGVALATQGVLSNMVGPHHHIHQTVPRRRIHRHSRRRGPGRGHHAVQYGAGASRPLADHRSKPQSGG